MSTTTRGEGFRRALHRGVHLFGRFCDTVLMLVILAIVLSILPAFAPELSKFEALIQLKDALSGMYAPVQNRLPDWINSYNRTSILFIIGILVIRNLINWRIDKLALNEFRRREIVARERPTDDEEDSEAAKRRQAAGRRVAVASYTEAKSILEAQKQDLTFLSLDIAGSTKMKDGEDPYVIEHAFVEYRKLVERIIQKHNVYKAAWTPDGQMFAFRSADDAVRSAKEILTALIKFNKEVSKMKQPFRLRAGANSGIVSTDDTTPMEQVSDESIDVAGHMQKYSKPGELWVSQQLAERLSDRAGIEPNGESVDGRVVHVWKTPESEPALTA